MDGPAASIDRANAKLNDMPGLVVAVCSLELIDLPYQL
jgi:hypothetical protein